MGSKLNKALEFIGVTRNTSDDDYEDDFYDDEEEAPKQEEKAVGRASNNNRYEAQCLLKIHMKCAEEGQNFHQYREEREER